MKQTHEQEIEVLENETPVLSNEEFLAERKMVLEGKIKGDQELIRKLELSIRTHKTLTEVVDENRDRFEQPDDIISQFTMINERFEAQLTHANLDAEKTKSLISMIENRDEMTAEEVLLVLLTA